VAKHWQIKNSRGAVPYVTSNICAGATFGVEGNRHPRCNIVAWRDHSSLRDSTTAAGKDWSWRGLIGHGKTSAWSARFCGRWRLPGVSSEDRGNVPAHESPPDVAVAQQGVHRGQIYCGREYSEDEGSRPALPHGCKGKRLLRNGGVLATAEPEDAHRADRFRDRLRGKRPNVFVLARQSAFPVARVVLDGVERVGKQSGIHRWVGGFRAAHCSAMPGMPRDVFCCGEFSDRGECLPKRRV
jgi:hypothetical protein